MPTFKPFAALRPRNELAGEVSCLPYDVMDTEEAKSMASGNPLSFLHVVRADIDVDSNGAKDNPALVEQKSSENFQSFVNDGTLVRDTSPCLYIYEQNMDGFIMTGIVGLCSVRDYESDAIKKHEHTLPQKEEDRIRHFIACGAQTEPVFFVYRNDEALFEVILGIRDSKEAEFDFVDDFGVNQKLWKVDEAGDIESIVSMLEAHSAFYIADGHHRTASAAKISGYSQGKVQNEYVMATLFDEARVNILSYNRLLHDTAGLSEEEILSKLKENFNVNKSTESLPTPSRLHQYSLYMGGKWHILDAKDGSFDPGHPVEAIDAQIAQTLIFDKIFGIPDPRTDHRLSFAGGIRGLKYLKEQVDAGEALIGLALYPVGMDQVANVADMGMVMPPKSTWFEPKLRSGLFAYIYE
ncbi:MAG: DUF1015 family protein [Eubacteriaceae bacterium]|nr:DUF1015 family protein [Eubacteriaceae bacterium]